MSYDSWLCDEQPQHRNEMPAPPDEPDDDVCKTCLGEQVIVTQHDVDDLRESSCPTCCDVNEPEFVDDQL